MKNHNEAQLCAKFDQLSAGHELIVATDTGDHRRLRMQAYDAAGLGWDVLTWNKFVSVVGSFFSGFTLFPMDLMTSFAPPSETGLGTSGDQLWIDPDGWSQKLTLGSAKYAHPYDPEPLFDQIKNYLTDHWAGRPDAADRIDAVLAEAREHCADENRARLWLMDHSILSRPPVSHWDLDQRDTTTFTDEYIYACLAIAATAKAYTEHKKEN